MITLHCFSSLEVPFFFRISQIGGIKVTSRRICGDGKCSQLSIPKFYNCVLLVRSMERVGVAVTLSSFKREIPGSNPARLLAVLIKVYRGLLQAFQVISEVS